MEIFLRYISDTRFQTDVAEDIDVHHTTVSKTINDVADGIFAKAHRRIKFPSDLKGNFLLLGNSGYGIAPWLLCPFKNRQCRSKELFIITHSRERVIIEGFWTAEAEVSHFKA
nr:unnamed protein product [Callosobruchus analis]